MSIGILVIELCLIGFIGIAYYLAKRDLNAVAARRQEPVAEEMREVQQTVERLIAALDRKSAEIEARLQRRFDELAALERAAAAMPRPVASPPSATIAAGAAAALPPKSGAAETKRHPAPFAADPAPDPAPAPAMPESAPQPIDKALAMLALGSDVSAAARATGLTVSEIEMAARMRQLREGRRQAAAADAASANPPMPMPAPPSGNNRFDVIIQDEEESQS